MNQHSTYSVRVFLIVSLLLVSSSLCLAQRFTVSGTVRDKETGESLPAANIRIDGTSKGTITNREGQFSLSLAPGPYALIVSYVGYESDSLRFQLTGNRVFTVTLVPVPIELPEVVVTDEDPAYRIMRRVIERKKIWSDSLRSYQFEAFTRQIMRRDTAIASIMESYTTGFWRKGDTLREVVRQKRQTENIPTAMNFASVMGIVNFYDDEIRFMGYRFVGFTSPEAFDYYEFKLLERNEVAGVPYYRIRVEPSTRLSPLFRGTIIVAGDVYALAGVDVKPNEAYIIPFVSELSISYGQQFRLYEDRYWMPADIRIIAKVEIGVAGLSIPPIGFDQVSSIYDYQINVPVPDSLFTKDRLIPLPEAEKFDSLFWVDHEVLPLTTEERTAYARLDSTQTLDKQFQPSGPLASLDGPGLSALEYVDLRFNRVEGGFVGGKIDYKKLSRFDLGAKLGYGFANKRTQWEADVRLYSDSTKKYGLGIGVFDRTDQFHDEHDFGSFGSSLFALFAKNDPQDYYYARGWRLSLLAKPSRILTFEIGYNDEKQEAAFQSTDFSLFYRRNAYRPNPPAQNGQMRFLSLKARVGREPIPLNLVSQDFLELTFDVAPSSVITSDFDFFSMLVRGEYHVPVLLRRNLFPPTLSIHAVGGLLRGDPPSQRLFTLPTRVSGYGPFGTLRGVRTKEFIGEEFFVIALEQNFRSIPFLMLDIPFLYQNAIEFIVHGAVARSWTSKDWTGFSGSATNGVYGEIGAGIGKIFGLLRADFTYRLSSPRGLWFTVALSRVL